MAAHHGKRRAQVWYGGQVFNLMPRKLCNAAYGGGLMLANYAKVALTHPVEALKYE